MIAEWDTLICSNEEKQKPSTWGGKEEGGGTDNLCFSELFLETFFPL